MLSKGSISRLTTSGYRITTVNQTRFLRIRPNDIKESPQPKLSSYKVKKTSSSVEDDYSSLIPRTNNSSIDSTLGRNQRLNSRSKFGKPTTKKTESSILDEFKNKSPAQIEREIKAKFEADGLEYDPMFAQQMIEHSKHEEDILKRLTKDEKSAIDVTQEEMIGYLDWLVQDAQEALKHQRLNPEKEKRINNKVNDIMNTSMEADSFVNAAISVDSLADDLKTTDQSKLPEFLRMVNQPTNIEMRKLIPVEYLSYLFDISSQYLDEDLRDECIYLSGNLIYSTKRMRADPINESFYIETLTNRGKFEQAAELYESRRDKEDTKNERFWLDTGANIYLKQDRVKKAETIANDMKKRFGYIHPILITSFISTYLRLGNSKKAFDWWFEMKSVMDEYGLVDYIETPDAAILDDESIVYAYHNRIEPVSFDNITDVVMNFLKFRHVDEAMKIIEIGTRRDKQYLYHIIKKFIDSVPYTGREALFQVIEKAREGQYHPGISKFILGELEKYQPTRSKSFQEVAVLDETVRTLKFILEKRSIELTSKQKNAASSIISSITIGSKLTSFECVDLFRILLLSKSRKTYTLVYKILSEMNLSLQLSREGKEYGIFPAANSHVYLVLVQLFGRRRNPGFSEINSLLSMMKSLNIKVYTILANQIILTYLKSKRFTEAASFIDDYLKDRDFRPTSEFYRNILKVYKNSIESSKFDFSDKNLFNERRENLRFLIQIMIKDSSLELEDDFFEETLITLMKYGDLPSVICVLQYYGMELNRNPDKKLMTIIKLSLESFLNKMESKLSPEEREQSQEKLQMYRQESGILSIPSMLKADTPLNWRDAASIILKYVELFNYAPNTNSLSDPYWTSISKEQQELFKANFERQLLDRQALYGLGEVTIDEIV
ncbi:hypothetical protein CANARDRAFT_225973 [[Candida] arabinofermentans NRRL YB-2248]|uniref:Uncharacterized protein n=1 Tax=[Candida] arabinofermentans NRRL YB-2248 TaxID=983967 RepID=A0A1E4SV88_9ASCO|nr:hypothetical protein CANARDRAFT_225973 [[Candida] arabinofermentans NRRL YB-2248]